MKRHVFLAVLVLLLGDSRPADADLIYWSDAGGGVERANLDGTGRTVVVSGLSLTVGVAVDGTGGFIYYAEGSAGLIGRANIDGTNKITLVNSLNFPVGVALDLAGSKIYWANSGNNTIGRANIDGTNQSNFISTAVSNPQGVGLDLVHGKIYWTDFSGAIERANLDGTGKQTLISGLNVGLGGPDGIALDVAGGKLYWANGGGEAIGQPGYIGLANLDGTGNTILVHAVAPIGIALDLTHGKMYWGTSSANNDLEVANLDGSGKGSFITGLNGPNFPTFAQTAPAAVPEPSSLVLASLAAVASFFGLTWRRKQKPVDKKCQGE